MKKNTLLALAFCAYTGLFAQNARINTKKGHVSGPTSTSVLGQNANRNGIVVNPNLQSIYSEDFASGLPATWQNIDNTGGGTELWQYTTSGSTNGNYILNPVGTTSANGFMMFDSDGGGATSAAEDADIISPAIDCSTESMVFVSFNEWFLQYANSVGTLSVSNDNVNWTAVYTVNVTTDNANPVYVDISSIAANQATVYLKFNYIGNYDYWWMIDDVSVFAPSVGLDLSVTSTIVGKDDPTPTFTAFTKYLTTLPLTIKNKVTNLATVPVTSFDYSWSDGTNTYNQSFTGLNIAPFTNYVFDASTNYTTLAGSTTVTSTISNINGGASELITSNNSGSYSVNGVTADPDKKYFAEEGTGTWCQWCPRGAVFMDYMRATYPNQFVGVAVHNGDPMTMSTYDGPFSVPGYPDVKVNRNPTAIDPSVLEADFINSITIAPSVIVTGSATLNLATNMITVDLAGVFNQNLTGDYRFMSVVIEDSVTGTGSPYAQVNAYGNNGAGPMGGFELLATTVPASQMHYDFVNRALLGTFYGQTGSLPGSVTSGTTYNYQFTNVAVGGTWVKSHLSAVAVVIDFATSKVLNATKFPINIVTGLNDNIGSLKGSYVYPTLTTDNINLSLNLENTDKVTVTVTDVLGKVILIQDLGTVQAGNSTQVWNVSNLSSGVYYLNLMTTDGKMTQKFVKQ